MRHAACGVKANTCSIANNDCKRHAEISESPPACHPRILHRPGKSVSLRAVWEDALVCFGHSTYDIGQSSDQSSKSMFLRTVENPCVEGPEQREVLRETAAWGPLFGYSIWKTGLSAAMNGWN